MKIGQQGQVGEGGERGRRSGNAEVGTVSKELVRLATRPAIDAIVRIPDSN